MLSPREVIDDIRRTEFGLEEPDAIPAIRNLRAMLHRALQQLAEEIYADGIHFILELVQNAEDNEYGDAAPELRFVLSRTHLHVLNNEIGFGEPSVRAICDVSRSTKTKAKGHIGEKGIGFKSVFRVTDEPQIFSNGYQFRLPKHDPDTRLGYVVPFWVDDVPSQVVPGVTNILLPLNAEAPDELAKVADIRPSLLLFLKQLRSVTMEDQVRDRLTQISRSGGDRRVELRSAGGVECWTLVRRTIPVRPDTREEKRKDITHTELAVALPLTADGDADGGHFHPVHAYLPIDDYGLRFAFHADFVLAAGREGILTDRPWNLWLRDSLPDLFLVAVEVCKNDERLRTSFLAYVPRPDDDVDPFFASSAEAIRDELRELPCVLAASGGWVTPSKALIADDAVQAILSNADVLRLLGKEFVARTFRADTALLCDLGATTFTLDDLVACLRAPDWVAERSDEWFTRLFAYLGTQDLDAYEEELRALPLVPLESGGLTSMAAARGGVFFPPSRRRKYGFESGLLVVRHSILASSEKGPTAVVTQLLRQLGVKQASPVELIREHVVPLFAAEDWKTRGDDFRHGCVEYVKDHWEECRKAPALVSKLKATLWVRIDGSNNVYHRPGSMYLSKAYGNTNPLKALFRGIDNIHFVDPVYLERAIEQLKQRKARAKRGKVTRGDRKKLREEWRQFFIDLGVETGIRIVPIPGNEKPNEAQSPDLAKVIETGEVDRITLALALLDAEWDRYARWMTTKRLVSQPRGRTLDLGSVWTVFGSLLTDTAWIPVVGGGLAKPGEVFCDTPATRELLSDRVAYLAVRLASAGLIDALGIHREPSVDAVIRRLRHLTRSGVRERASFEPLYTFLQDHYHEASDAIDTAFWHESLILIPGETPRVVRAGQAFWKDFSVLFGDGRGYLEPVYPQQKKFFRTQLEVSESPTLEDYGDRLVELAEAGVADAASEKVVWAIYKEFNRQMRERRQRDEIVAADWWEEFIDQAVFLSEDGTFVERGEVVANDSDDFAASFRGQPGVTFFKSSADRLPQVRHFLRGAGVRFLSQAVKQEAVVPRSAEPNDPLTDQVRLITPFLLRYLHHRESDLYDRLRAGGKLGRLESMHARTCERPRARLLLDDVTVEVDRAVVIADDTLYVRTDALDDADSVAIALAHWLGNPKGLEDFLVSMLEKRQAEKIRRFLARKGIPDLPGEETETIGEAVRSAEFGASESPSTVPPAVEEPATVGLAVSDGRDIAAGSGVPAPPSAAPTGGPYPGGDIPVERRGPPPQLESRDGTRERPKTDPPAPPRRPAATPDARQPPSPATGRAPAPDWRECAPGEARVSWNAFEPLQPRGPRLVPSPGSAPSPEHQQGNERSTDGAAGSSSDREPDDPPDVRCDVGRWGEEYALGCLREELLAKYPGAVSEETARGFRLRRRGGIVAEVIWLNRGGEQGVGYDIEVIEGASRLFVEVKSTRDETRAVFDLSDAQWELAKAQGPSYRIIRVYNAGRREARAVHVADPYRAWQAGELTIRSLRIVL